MARKVGTNSGGTHGWIQNSLCKAPFLLVLLLLPFAPFNAERENKDLGSKSHNFMAAVTICSDFGAQKNTGPGSPALGLCSP